MILVIDYRDNKMAMRGNARLIKGLANLLLDDVEQIYADVDSYDIIGLEEAIREAKRTTQRLNDSIIDLEHCLYQAKQDEV